MQLDRRENEVLLTKYIAVATQSFQQESGILDWNIKALTTFRICWCFFMKTEFCCGVSTQEWKETTLSYGNNNKKV